MCLFRDEDDLNDVASMAGVSVSEERARILATGAESVGLVIRSCRDEPFLCPSALRTRITNTGKDWVCVGEGESVCVWGRSCAHKSVSERRGQDM